MLPETMVAWKVQNGALEFGEAATPEVPAGYALVEIVATSVNPGEVLYLPHMPAGHIPGLEAAGVVVQSADGIGPTVGSRVIVLTGGHGGGWGQYVAVPADQLGILPESVPWSDAAGLANAGLTALYAVRMGGALLGAEVLITGVTGAVGRYAAQLAALSGARVSGTVSSETRKSAVTDLGLKEVVVGNSADGPYDMVIDTLGGGALNHAMAHIVPRGIVVAIVGGGQAMNRPEEVAAIPLSWEFSSPGARVQTLNVAAEAAGSASVGRDLTLLGTLAATGLLPPETRSVSNWREAADLVSSMKTSPAKGKIVLLTDRSI